MAEENKYGMYQNQAGSGTSTDDYYKMARDQEFKTLLDAEVALENSRTNALRMTNEQARNSGFFGTGYASTANAGIYNSYMNQVNNARGTYQANMAQLDQQQKEANETESALAVGNAQQMISEAPNQANLEEIMVQSGYGTRGDDGKFVLFEEKPEGMTDQEWLMVTNAYRNQMYALGADASSGTKTPLVKNYPSPEAITEGVVEYYSQSKKKQMDVRRMFNHELDRLDSELATGRFSAGDVVALRQGKNGEGDQIYIRILNGGKIAIVTELPENVEEFWVISHGEKGKETKISREKK